MMAERGIDVDHSTLNRWVIFYETYIKLKGQWKYYYRVVDKQGNTVYFLLTAERDKKAALRYLTKAIKRSGQPGLINIDKSGANKSGIKQFNSDNNKRIKIRQCKYLNNIIEQDHRRIKLITRPMLGFQGFHCVQSTLSGIEVVAMINKAQMKNISGILSCADQFYALAA